MCCLWSASLLTMSIGSGVILSVTFEKIDRAPNAEASAQRDNKGLQNFNCTSEKLHLVTSIY